MILKHWESPAPLSSPSLPSLDKIKAFTSSIKMVVKSFYALSLLAVCGIVSGLPADIQTKVSPTTTLDSWVSSEFCLRLPMSNITGRSGRGTIYYQMGAAGSCGAVHGDGDYIVALGPNYMKGPKSPYCGRRISAKNTSNGKTVTVTVADTCPTCGPGDIDFALGPWNALTNNASPGVFPLSWYVL